MLRAVALGVGTSLASSLWVAGASADGPSGYELSPRSVNWSGWHAGTHSGGALDKSDFSNPYGPTLFGDEVRSPGALAGIQIGYDKHYGALVVGFEADVSWADFDGTFTCLQPSAHLPGFNPSFVGGAFGATCRSQMDWLGTLTGRLGTVVGDDGRTLLYAKGGLAWGHSTVDMITNNLVAEEAGPPNAASRSSFTEWGWTLGAGVEYAVSSAWSLRAEYDYVNLGSHDLPTPNARPITLPGYPGVNGSVSPDGRAASVEQDIHAFKLGLNYRFGNSGETWTSVWTDAFDASTRSKGPRSFEIEVGARYVHWWSRFQQDLVVPSNISRLTWDDIETDSGEVFWRIDAPRGLLVKGLWGKGSGSDGHINDEDWGMDEGTFVQPYQNTNSDADAETKYVTVDVGYNWLRGASYKLTPFVGYSFFRQDMNAHGVTYENFSPSVEDIPKIVVPLKQKTDWHALRLGSAAELMLTARLKLSAEAAYLPYIRFEGTDVHPLRTDVTSFYSPQWGDGTGVELEAVLTYDVTDRFSIGVGGRYRSQWVSDGATDNFSSGDIVPQRFAAEQAAVFLQGSYKFDGPCCDGLLK